MARGRRGQSPPADSRAAEKPDWVWARDDALFDKLEALETLAEEAGVAMGAYSLAWTLLQPAMSSLIVGVKSMEQIRQAIGNIHDATQQNLTSSRQAELAAAELNRLGTMLVELVGRGRNGQQPARTA